MPGRKWSSGQSVGMNFSVAPGSLCLACLGVHDKRATNEQFIRCFGLIEDAAKDERNFVKKGVSWALRVIGRRNIELNKAATQLAQQLAASTNPTSRWLGKEALREFNRPLVRRQLEKHATRHIKGGRT